MSRFGPEVLVVAYRDDGPHGTVVVDQFLIEHAVSPKLVLASRGWTSQALPEVRHEGNTVQLWWPVSPGDVIPLPTPAPTVRTAVGQPEAVVAPLQRVGTYAFVRGEYPAGSGQQCLLVTEYSGLTGAQGHCGLPGGGVDEGESPHDALVRECWEETGQVVRIDPHLVEINDSHRIGPGRNGVVEDYHSIRLVFQGWCDAATEAVVHDVGGSTQAARWVPIERILDEPWTDTARALIMTCAASLTPPLPLPGGAGL